MIPVYRARTIKQDYNEWEECEQLKRIGGIWYAIGFYDCKREIKTYLGDWETTHLILIRKSTAISEVSTAEVIDISTLSIHFPDILDSQRKKIFASLQEDGKGGDIIALDDIIKTVIWCNKTQAIMLSSKQTGLSILSLYKDDIKIISIQE